MCLLKSFVKRVIMKIKLISPLMKLRPVDSLFKRLMAPSLSLLTVAALTPSRHLLSLEDENTGALHLDDTPDLVGINVNVETSRRAYQIADQYRERKITVVMGGIHPSANPEEALAHCDAVCIGAAEPIWEQMIADAEGGELKKQYQGTATDEMIERPYPRWSLVDSSRYLYTNIVCTSVGCSFRCDFCYNSSSYMPHRIRNRSVESVRDEVIRLDTSHIMFIDDNFIGNPAWTSEFLKVIKPLGLRWNAAVSANIVEYPNLLDEMAESGCQSLFIGFESINSDSLRSVRKFQNKVESYERLIGELHDRAIMINASLVFGLDCDYPEVFKKTCRWLVKNRISTITAHILTPYPGTVLFRKLHAEGRIVDYDWSHYDTAHVVFQPLNMTLEELYDGYLWLYRSFYTLEAIFRRLPPDRSQWKPYLLFNFIYRKYGSFFSQLASRLGIMGSLGQLARKLSYGID